MALRDFALASRITVYTSAGELDETWTFPGGLIWTFRGAAPIQVDMAGRVWMPFKTSARPSPDQRKGFIRTEETGQIVDTLPFPVAPEVPVETVQVGVRRLSAPYQVHGTWAWSPAGTFAAARTDAYRIEVFPPKTQSAARSPGEGLSGRSRVISRDIPPVPVPRAEREAALRGLAERVAKYTGLEKPSIPEIPAEKPPIKSLSYSEDGRLIVGVSMPSKLRDGEWTEERAYDLFGTDGRFLGRFSVPSSFRIMGMRGDRIWGVFRGEYGVESVRLFRVGGLGPASARSWEGTAR